MFLADELPCTNEKHFGYSVPIVGDHSNHVLVFESIGDHLLACYERLDRLHLIADLRSFLELQVRCRIFHLCNQPADELFPPAFEKCHHVPDHRHILILGDLSRAHSRTLIDMVGTCRPCP